MKKVVQKSESMSAAHILNSLAKIHEQDVFVPECKDGSSWGGHFRLDAWTMNKSWSNLRFTGYEIKVNRRDYKQDDKWQAYLPLCNQFFFVCPNRMLEPSEIPEGVGLKYCHPSGHITVAKKAGFRECNPPQELFAYLLMCRTRIVSTTYGGSSNGDPEHKLEKYRRWIKEKEESRDIGQVIKYSVARQIDTVRQENKSLRSRLEFIERAEKVLREMGIYKNFYDSDDQERRIREQALKFIQAVPDTLKQELRTIIHAAQLAVGQIEDQESKLKPPVDRQTVLA